MDFVRYKEGRGFFVAGNKVEDGQEDGAERSIIPMRVQSPFNFPVIQLNTARRLRSG